MASNTEPPLVQPLVNLWVDYSFSNASPVPSLAVLQDFMQTSIQCPLCSNVVLFNDYFTHLHDEHPVPYHFWLYYSLPEPLGGIESYDDTVADAYDVDRMSYEELLDLCQTIGNHTIGLTEAQKEQATMAYHPTPEESQVPPRCTICLMEATESPTVVRLRHCGHIHCKECIYEWLTRHKTCPVCIQEVLPEKLSLESIE